MKKQRIFLDGKEIPREELKRLLWLSSSLFQDWSAFVGFLQNASWERKGFRGTSVLVSWKFIRVCLDASSLTLQSRIGIYSCTHRECRNTSIQQKQGSVKLGSQILFYSLFFFSRLF
jgi:hypothetical protein